MTPQEIMDSMRKATMTLSTKNDEMKEYSAKYAEAERNYNVAVAKRMLEYRDESMPVTIIEKLVKGDPHVAKLRLDMLIAEAIRDACIQRARDLRSEIDVWRSILTWEREEYRNANLMGG